MKRRVLVFGAGVIGSIYALRLAKAGHQVSILARGERLAALRTRGLAIRHASTGEEEETEAEILETLREDAKFDIAIVALRSGQITGALRRLGPLSSMKAILVLGNNLEDLAAESLAAGESRLVLGFGAFGGYREGSAILYADGRSREKPGMKNASPTTLGIISEAARPAMETLRATFEAAGLLCKESPDIAAWLLCHAALVFPLAGAIFATGGDQARLTRTRDAMLLGIRACKEAIAALRAQKVRIEPTSLRKLLAMPEWLLLRILSKSLASDGARVAMFGHANAVGGRGEIGGQAMVLDTILGKAGYALPDWERLLPWFDTKNALEPMADGAKSLRLRIW